MTEGYGHEGNIRGGAHMKMSSLINQLAHLQIFNDNIDIYSPSRQFPLLLLLGRNIRLKVHNMSNAETK